MSKIERERKEGGRERERGERREGKLGEREGRDTRKKNLNVVIIYKFFKV